MNQNVTKQFIRYVAQNIFGMIGMSLYILADTFFISRAVGADGITALNLVLPLYNFIYAIGLMIGVGAAIRFSIAARQNKDAHGFFMNSIEWGVIIGLLFSFAGLFFPDKIMTLLGGDETIVGVGEGYTRIFMSFSPFFICNHICNAFVRNDGNPSLAMASTLLSSLFNIVFDYVLMFPCGLGMEGAALATACSPVVGIGICMFHFLGKKSTISLKPVRPSARKLFGSCQVGFSAFVGEMSSGVITVVFNYIILGLAGNLGVAAYGIVANTALVAVATLNGVAQGSQPLLSSCYGRGDMKNVRKIRNMGMITAAVIGIIILAVGAVFAPEITGIFNRDNDAGLAEMAAYGIRIYFVGFVFAGINIVGGNAFSAVEKAKWAFVTSVMRGFVVIIACAFLLSSLFGMTGVWCAYPAAEAITAAVTLAGASRIGKSAQAGR